ncbi:MAG: C-terminal binding protein [Bacteroidales bacterium]|nr:C-terminal binding protein [Bacteroidales bacterium]
MEIVILDPGYNSYDSEKEIFEKGGFLLRIFHTTEGSQSEKIEFAKKADGILVRHTRIDKTFLSAMNNLKAVVRYGVGYDNIDLESCTRYGVRVANVQGYANQSVSDHAIALMFSCTRALWNPGFQLMNRFSAPPVVDIFELHDKTLGIIGLGRIGSEFCKKASHFFMQVLSCDPYKPESHFSRLNARKVELDELLEKSNVISLHCNLTPETRHLLGTGQFHIMKKKPVIINTSRGPVICESSLIEALDSGKIHSAGLDVFENEPVTENQARLVNHPRVICTGHYAWYSDYASMELQRRAAMNMLDLLNGRTIEDSLN